MQNALSDVLAARAGRSPPAAPGAALRVGLALQGGGAWGAYTWGVLDRLLSRRGLEIDAISGASAGAINGAIVASALGTRGGSARLARQALESFWRANATEHGAAAPLSWLGPLGAALGERLEHWAWTGAALGPYQSNPLNLNPLRRAIETHVDAQALRSQRGPALFVTATNARTGLPRVFGPAEIGVDALMASACLPQLFQAVEIDGEHYWDGGFAGNPSIWPLVREGGAADVILVQLAAEAHATLPRRPQEIRRRIGELVFNASLIAEMQSLQAMRSMCARAGLDAPVARLRLHRVGPPRERADAGPRVALDRSWPRLSRLAEQGRRDAARFFALHRERLGRSATLDLAAFVDPRKPRSKARIA